VRVISFAFAAQKFQKRIEEFGGTFVGLPSVMNESEIIDTAVKQGIVPFGIQRQLMYPSLSAELQSSRPDVIISDQCTMAAMELATEFGIRLVVNIAGPYDLYKSAVRAPYPETSMSIPGGLILMYTPLKQIMIPDLLGLAGIRQMLQSISDTIIKAKPLVLVNSFFGLELAEPLDPFVVFTGPLFAPIRPSGTALAQHNPQLSSFLDGATQVVYVTTGSMIKMEKWMVGVIFNALKEVGCHVVWSLKAEVQKLLPAQNHPKFFISAWLPQIQLLGHEKVAAVITHCGWGGTLECMSAGKPVIALPFFGDQPENAAMLIKAGAGKQLGPHPQFSLVPDGKGCYPAGSITVSMAAGAIRDVLQDKDGTLLVNARRLSHLSQAAGLGAERALDRVEFMARHGADHLHTRDRALAVFRGTPTIVFWGAVGVATALAVLFRKFVRPRWKAGSWPKRD
jgi:UDP:flavonoid glycosyltransferase YjiC (YdhE family)